ncbi:hypothetical protein, partial [Paenibacillus chitinolyticus]|uniref:hypothetical protein n=1 Tax=Paenibacillus chitinolyticus TaxID=79263 RepID=UPI00295E4D39
NEGPFERNRSRGLFLYGVDFTGVLYFIGSHNNDILPEHSFCSISFNGLPADLNCNSSLSKKRQDVFRRPAFFRA